LAHFFAFSPRPYWIPGADIWAPHASPCAPHASVSLVTDPWVSLSGLSLPIGARGHWTEYVAQLHIYAPYFTAAWAPLVGITAGASSRTGVSGRWGLAARAFVSEGGACAATETDAS
jgi:hypothetical protein